MQKDAWNIAYAKYGLKVSTDGHGRNSETQHKINENRPSRSHNIVVDNEAMKSLFDDPP